MTASLLRSLGARVRALRSEQALSLRDRPDFPNRRDIAVPPDIHWKTGTSFGFRDAWAVGSGPTYTAVVWTGNVDNRPSTDLIGSEAARPLLFDVLESVDHTKTSEAQPDDLVNALNGVFGAHKGKRAAHTKGICLKGNFTPTA